MARTTWMIEHSTVLIVDTTRHYYVYNVIQEELQTLMMTTSMRSIKRPLFNAWEARPSIYRPATVTTHRYRQRDRDSMRPRQTHRLFSSLHNHRLPANRSSSSSSSSLSSPSISPLSVSPSFTFALLYRFPPQFQADEDQQAMGKPMQFILRLGMEPPPPPQPQYQNQYQQQQPLTFIHDFVFYATITGKVQHHHQYPTTLTEHWVNPLLLLILCLLNATILWSSLYLYHCSGIGILAAEEISLPVFCADQNKQGSLSRSIITVLIWSISSSVSVLRSFLFFFPFIYSSYQWWSSISCWYSQCLSAV